MYCKRFRHACSCPVTVFGRIDDTSCIVRMKDPVVCNTATGATYKFTRNHVKYNCVTLAMFTKCQIIFRMYLLFSWFHRDYVLGSAIISSFSRNNKFIVLCLHYGNSRSDTTNKLEILIGFKKGYCRLEFGPKTL